MFTRRCLAAGLTAGMGLVLARVPAAARRTDTAGLVDGEARIPVPGGPIPAYFAKPAGAGPFPTVLVVEDILGVNAWIKDVCRRLAKAGYLAVAPHLYARIADLARIRDVAQIKRDVIAREPDAAMLSDLDATAKWAAANGGNQARLGVMGFGWGGRDAWLYAEHNPNLKAAVVWYGPVTGPTTTLQPQTPLELAGALKCPLLGLYGAKEDNIKPKDVNAAAAKGRAAGRAVDIAWFPEAPDGFANENQPTYMPEDATNAWKRAFAWFEDHGLG